MNRLKKFSLLLILAVMTITASADNRCDREGWEAWQPLHVAGGGQISYIEWRKKVIQRWSDNTSKEAYQFRNTHPTTKINFQFAMTHVLDDGKKVVYCNSENLEPNECSNTSGAWKQGRGIESVRLIPMGAKCPKP